MKWFLDLSARNRLFICFGLMFVLMAWVIATAYTGMATMSESQDRLYQEDFASLRDLQSLRVNQDQTRALMLEAQLLSKRTEQNPLLAQAAERSQQIDHLILGLLALAMENIKQASVQNVAGTKQAEVAAQSLHELGQTLKQVAMQYKT